VENSEFFQVVKYKKGQFYKMHHDQNSALYTPQGARMYTFFLYLKTPASGGATHFNDLDIHVEANRGNAILWPSMLDSDVTLPDLRTHHESLPVLKGVKFAANLWIHQHDFRTGWLRGCPLASRDSYYPDAQLKFFLRGMKAAGKPVELPPSMHTFPRAHDILAAVLAES